MDPEWWRRAKDLFDKALALPEAERRAFIDAECTNDSALREEVLALLGEDARGDSSLEENVASWARKVLEPPAPAFRSIGPYRVLRLLGRGGMGAVYLAEQPGRHVAIKVLSDASLSHGRRERFEREQHVLAQLTHASIARLYEANTLDDGTPYFVMEYVEGMSITRYCATNACTLAQRLAVFREVCEAVQYAHREAVIHRDLAGVRHCQADRKSGSACFGHADRAHDDAGLRGAGATMWHGGWRVHGRLRTRSHPLRIADQQTALRSEGLFTHAAPRKPSADASDDAASPVGRPSRAEWADLDLICLTAAHQDPQRRYSSVEALIRDLDRFRNIEPLEASPDRLGYRLGKFLRRNRGPVAGTAVALVNGWASCLLASYCLNFTDRDAGST